MAEEIKVPRILAKGSVIFVDIEKISSRIIVQIEMMIEWKTRRQ